MFINFSQRKTHYNKGQVFPFMIAILVVIVIMAMIVVNLGQIAVFKTDTSNAADAAGLAGASVLSQTLLSLGLKSDTMCGLGAIAVAFMTYYIVEGKIWEDIIWITAIYIAHKIKTVATYLMCMSEGFMGWANAKKTALQFAYNNAGVDEPKMRFSKSGLTYEEYLKSETLKPGFSRFMEHSLTGFTKGPYTPNGLTMAWNPEFWQASPVIVKTGYGWTQNEDSSIKNSYDETGDYSNYENWVEVEVIGATAYALGLKSFVDVFGHEVANVLYGIALIFFIKKYKVIPYWGVVIGIALATWFRFIILTTVDCGLEMDEAGQTDNNPISVQVTRHKREKDLGLWKFQYGNNGNVVSKAYAHAYREESGITISPTMFPEDFSWMDFLVGDVNGDWFDTDRHLFETKLIYVR